MSTLTVACVQHACTDDPAANLAASAAGIRAAAAQGAQLVLLQELHRTPYFCQVQDPALCDLAEPVPGPTSAYLGDLARELGIVIVGSVFERRLSGVYHNTAVVLERDGTLAGIYRKMHIPDDPGYLEKFYFTPGDGPFAPIDTSVGRLGVLVCWDQWYPEAARLMTLAGADLLLYPTAIGWEPGDTPAEQARQREAWLTIQRAHAIANGLPVLAANRVGLELMPGGPAAGSLFWGSSFIAGPQGEYLAQAPTDAPAVICADIDPARGEQVRRIWPFLRDRRIDAYQDLTRRVRD
ncbi:MAG: carbon-nitrogen hydrolase [Pseudomonadota bacterium]